MITLLCIAKESQLKLINSNVTISIYYLNKTFAWEEKGVETGTIEFLRILKSDRYYVT